MAWVQNWRLPKILWVRVRMYELNKKVFLLFSLLNNMLGSKAWRVSFYLPCNYYGCYFHTKKTLRKNFGKYFWNNIWKLQLIELHLKTSSSNFHATFFLSTICFFFFFACFICLFLSRVCLKLFYTATLSPASFNLHCNSLCN